MEKFYTKIRKQAYQANLLDELEHRTYKMDTQQDVQWNTYVGTTGTQGAGIINQAAMVKNVKNENLMHSTGPWWIDGNHSINGDGFLSLPFVLCTMPNNWNKMKLSPNFIFPLINTMKVRGKVKGIDINLKGAEFVFWYQYLDPTENKYINVINDKQPIKLQNDWYDFEVEVNLDDTSNLSFLPNSPEKELLYTDKFTLPSKPVFAESLGFVLYPYKVNHILQDEQPEALISTVNIPERYENIQRIHTWPIDTTTLPTGTILMKNLEIEYFTNVKLTSL